MIIFRNSAEGVSPDLPRKTIKHGDILTLKVIKKIEGAWQVSLGGKLHTADIKNLTVHPGQHLTARAYFDGKILILKVLEEEGMGASATKDGFASSNFSMEVLQKSIFDLVQALAWSIEGDELEQLVSVLYQFKREDQGFIRFLLILLDKGLPLSFHLISAIEQELEGRSGKRGKGKDKEKDLENTEDYEKESDRSLEKIEGSPLQLVNHLQGIRENWIFLPLSIKRKNSEKKGLLKIQTLENNARGKATKNEKSWEKSIHRIVFTITHNGESWGFIIKNCNKPLRTLIIYAEGEKKGKKIVNAVGNLEKYMRKLHIEVDKNIKDWEDFNGFDEKTEKRNINVNTFA